MELCRVCRKLLYRTDPCKGSGECRRTDGGSKSTAARKDVRPTELGDDGHKVPQGSVERSRSIRRDSRVASPADTQVPPVDTPKRGRPRTGFDKKAYDRIKAAERRAKIKAAK